MPNSPFHDYAPPRAPRSGGPASPYWDCLCYDSGDVTLTSGASEDWDAMLGEAEPEPWLFDVPTLSGWLSLRDVGTDTHRRAVLSFYNGGPAFTSRTKLVSDRPGADAYVQISVNGEVTEHTINASPWTADLDVEVKEGPNRIAVVALAGCLSVELRGRFMDPAYCEWVRPTDSL